MAFSTILILGIRPQQQHHHPKRPNKMNKVLGTSRKQEADRKKLSYVLHILGLISSALNQEASRIGIKDDTWEENSSKRSYNKESLVAQADSVIMERNRQTTGMESKTNATKEVHQNPHRNRSLGIVENWTMLSPTPSHIHKDAKTSPGLGICPHSKPCADINARGAYEKMVGLGKRKLREFDPPRLPSKRIKMDMKAGTGVIICKQCICKNTLAQYDGNEYLAEPAGEKLRDNDLSLPPSKRMRFR